MKRMRMPVLFTWLLAAPLWAIGPNIMLSNSGFEGPYYYSMPEGGPFAMIKEPANAHTGVRSL